jgi:hypothetical protein
VNRKTRTIAAVAGAAVLALPGIAEAKTYKVNASFSGSQNGTALTAKIRDKSLGKCTMKGKLVIPKTQQTWTCKGGKIRITGTGTTGASNDAKGTWKVTGGTGKFKGAKGGGTFAGKLSTAKFKYRGKIRT